MDITTVVAVVSALLAISEGLALIPGVKSNSIFQMIYFTLRAIVKGVQAKEV